MSSDEYGRVLRDLLLIFEPEPDVCPDAVERLARQRNELIDAYLRRHEVA